MSSCCYEIRRLGVGGAWQRLECKEPNRPAGSQRSQPLLTRRLHGLSISPEMGRDAPGPRPLPSGENYSSQKASRGGAAGARSARARGGAQHHGSCSSAPRPTERHRGRGRARSRWEPAGALSTGSAGPPPLSGPHAWKALPINPHDDGDPGTAPSRSPGPFKGRGRAPAPALTHPPSTH